jgi:hypothetical protein
MHSCTMTVFPHTLAARTLAWPDCQRLMQMLVGGWAVRSIVEGREV